MTLRDDKDRDRHQEADDKAARLAEFGRQVDRMLQSMEASYIEILAEIEGDRDSAPDVAVDEEKPEKAAEKAAEKEAKATVSVDETAFHGLLQAWIEMQNFPSPTVMTYFVRYMINPIMRSLTEQAAEKGWMDW